MTSTTSFLHRVHVALISVSLTLLCLSPVHISPFNSRVLFESAWKKKLNSSALKISYNLYPDSIVGTSVFFQYAVIYGLHDFASLDSLKPLSPNPTKWSNTLKQFVGNLTTNCLSVFDHFVGSAIKGLTIFTKSLMANLRLGFKTALVAYVKISKFISKHHSNRKFTITFEPKIHNSIRMEIANLNAFVLL